MDFFKGIGRMFTIPRSVRKQIDSNPVTPVVQAVLKQEIGTVISTAVDNNVADQDAANAIKLAIGHAVEGTGIFN